jgi:hypothetical protein
MEKIKIELPKRKKTGRAPVHKPTKTFKDKKQYTRKKKHKIQEDT